MRNQLQTIRMFLSTILVAAATAQLAQAQSPLAMEAYVEAYDRMGKRSALMFNQMTQQINARARVTLRRTFARSRQVDCDR